MSVAVIIIGGVVLVAAVVAAWAVTHMARGGNR